MDAVAVTRVFRSRLARAVTLVGTVSVVRTVTLAVTVPLVIMAASLMGRCGFAPACAEWGQRQPESEHGGAENGGPSGGTPRLPGSAEPAHGR